MNTFITFLNETGERFLDFAWPMFWQSSLLIVALLLLDFLLRRHVRAVVRYALLLLILAKLVIPPSVALPTSLAWWLVPAKQIQEAQAPKVVITEVPNTTLSFPVESMPVSATEAFVMPSPQLEPGGWLMIGWCGIGIVLTGWLLLRAQSIRRRIRRGSAGPVELAQLLDVEQTSGLSGMVTGEAAAEGDASVALADRRSVPRGGAQVLLCDDDASPAVCGLFRPVILLPRRLLDRLTADQLRAVLLHEVAHIRRCDVWVNCMQILLQVVYWWHPLVWLANAHIRRVREEVVDETVQVALGNEADVYPSTLVEVARNIIAQPRLSLGLVGIAEPGSALGRRIRRMLDRPVPRSSRLNLPSVIAILVCAALLLPMARGQQRAAAATAGVPDAEPDALINVNVMFVEASEEVALSIWESSSNRTTIADQPWRALLSEAQVKSLESDSVFAISNAIPVITLSGRQAQIQSIEIRTILNGIRPEALDYPGVTSTNEDTAVAALATESMRFGYVLDVIPVVDAGTNSVTMSLTASATDFLGYAEKTPADDRLVYVNGILQRVTAPSPLIRKGLISLSTSVEDGVTLVLGNPMDENGHPVESPGDGKKRLLIFVTPTVVDAYGNRVHATAPTTNPPPARTIVPAPYPIRNVGETATNTSATTVKPEGESSQTSNSSFADSLPESMYEKSTNATVVYGYKLREPESTSTTNHLEELWVQRVIENGVILQKEGNLRAASKKFKEALALEPENTTAMRHLGEIQEVLASQQNFPSNNLVYTSTARQQLMAKLNSIRLDEVLFDGIPLGQAVRELGEAARKADPEGTGINFIISPVIQRIDEQTGRPVNQDLAAVPINIQPPLKQVRLVDVLNAIVKSSEVPIKFSIGDYAVVFSKRANELPPLYTRVFRVHHDTVVEGLVREGWISSGTTNIAAQGGAIREFFAYAGVDLTPPKAMFYKDREGHLLVRATLQDFDIIETALSALTARPPLVHLKVDVVEIEPPNTHNLNDWLRLDAQIRTTAPGVSGSSYGILTDPQRRVIMRSLEQRNAANTITETSVTTHSGRQAQVQVLGSKAGREEGKIGRRVVPPTGDSSTNGPSTDGNIVYDAVPTLDIIPSVSDDGFTIQLTLLRTTLEFPGYDDPGAFSIEGQAPDLSLPRFKVRQVTTRANVYDGQTVLMFMEVPTNSEKVEDAIRLWGALPLKDRQQTKDYLIFVTPTIIDPAGNRVNKPGDLPFTSDRIPPQKQQ